LFETSQLTVSVLRLLPDVAKIYFAKEKNVVFSKKSLYKFLGCGVYGLKP